MTGIPDFTPLLEASPFIVAAPRPSKIEIIAATTSISIRVKPRFFKAFDFFMLV
jgi:hypothetical protein